MSGAVRSRAPMMAEGLAQASPTIGRTHSPAHDHHRRIPAGERSGDTDAGVVVPKPGPTVKLTHLRLFPPQTAPAPDKPGRPIAKTSEVTPAGAASACFFIARSILRMGSLQSMCHVGNQTYRRFGVFARSTSAAALSVSLPVREGSATLMRKLFALALLMAGPQAEAESARPLPPQRPPAAGSEAAVMPLPVPRPPDPGPEPHRQTMPARAPRRCRHPARRPRAHRFTGPRLRP